MEPARAHNPHATASALENKFIYAWTHLLRSRFRPCSRSPRCRSRQPRRDLSHRSKGYLCSRTFRKEGLTHIPPIFNHKGTGGGVKTGRRATELHVVKTPGSRWRAGADTVAAPIKRTSALHFEPHETEHSKRWVPVDLDAVPLGGISTTIASCRQRILHYLRHCILRVISL